MPRKRILNAEPCIYFAKCKNSPGYLFKSRVNSTLEQKWFLVKTYGGEKEALHAAKKYRDSYYNSLGMSPCQTGHRFGTGINGEPGIRDTISYSRGYYYTTIVASGGFVNGKLQSKRFSYGNIRTYDEALALAIETRKRFIHELEEAKAKDAD